ncbi:MAG: hypothetical protein ACRCSP_00650 [Rhodoglobus sp.]
MLLSQHTRRRLRQYLTIPLLALTTVAATPTVAHAADPVKIVHEEKVQAGPYELTLGFSRWPLAEGVSFDLIIDPAEGITGKSGTLSMITPSGRPSEYDSVPLARHPRQRESWGLDVVSFEDSGVGGRWSLQLMITGADGDANARVVLPFDPLPGPSQKLSWALATVPSLLIIIAIAIAWIRMRPGRQADSWSLDPG